MLTAAFINGIHRCHSRQATLHAASYHMQVHTPSHSLAGPEQAGIPTNLGLHGSGVNACMPLQLAPLP